VRNLILPPLDDERKSRIVVATLTSGALLAEAEASAYSPGE